METLEGAIRRLISESYGSIPSFASKIDTPASSVYSALERGMANTRTELTDKIYRELNIDWDSARLDDFRELKLKSDSSFDDYVEVPLYGSIAAGEPIEMISCHDTHPVPSAVRAKYPDGFLLKVDGESMNRVLPNGCYAYIDPSKTVDRPMKPYAVCVNGYDATIKRVRSLNNGFELVPDSSDPTYKPTVYDYGIDDTPEITVIGRVVWYCVPFDWEF